MHRLRLLHLLWAVAITVTCTAKTLWCQSNDKTPIPEYYGTYAVSKGQLVAVDSGSVTTTTSPVMAGQHGQAYQICRGAAVIPDAPKMYNVADFQGDVKFLVFVQTSGMISSMMLAKDLKVGALGFVRNVNVNCGNATKSGLENGWETVTRYVDLRFKPVPGHEEMVLAVPSSPLDPGVYVLSGGSLQNVLWFAVSPVASAEKTKCVDLTLQYNAAYVFNGGAMREDVTPCGSGAASPEATPHTSQEVTPPATSSSECGDFDTCMRQGHSAFDSSNWQAALSAFQKAADQRRYGLPWLWIGNTYLAMGRVQDSPAAWDKALAMRFPLPFNVCHQRGIQGCEIGTLQIGNNVSLSVSGRSVFDVPVAEIVAKGSQNHRNQGFVDFGLDVSGKHFGFGFIPFGVNCNVMAHVNCRQDGVLQQMAVGDYISQTVPKLTSGTVWATAFVNPPATQNKLSLCSQATDSGYSILLEGHLYKVKAAGSPGADQPRFFFDEKGGRVTDQSILQQLASAAWTRDNVVTSPDARNGVVRVSGILGTSAALVKYSAVQDALTRAMVESVEAAATGGASLSKALPNLTIGVLSSQLKSAPKTVFTLLAQRGLETSLDTYKQMVAVPLPPSEATAFNASELAKVKTLYIQARSLELPYEALAAKLMPTSASDLTNAAFQSAFSQVIAGPLFQGASPSSVLTLKSLFDLQKQVENLGATLPALQSYSQNLNLALKLANANGETISKIAKQAAQSCQ